MEGDTQVKKLSSDTDQKQGRQGMSQGLEASPQGSITLEDFKEVRKTKKGAVESADVKARFNLANDQQINHISCNQTQEYFAVATNIGFEIVQNDS
jgi:hypothetical protein